MTWIMNVSSVSWDYGLPSIDLELSPSTFFASSPFSIVDNLHYPKISKVTRLVGFIHGIMPVLSLYMRTMDKCPTGATKPYLMR